MNKRIVVGSSTVYQWTQEESRPPVHLVIGRQTLVQTLEPAETENSKPAQIPLTMFRKKPGECWTGQIPTDKREFTEVHPSWGEIPAWHWRKKNVPPTKNILHGADLSGCSDFSLRGKGEQWVSDWLLQLCGIQLVKLIFLQEHPKYWGETGGRKDIGKEADKNFKGH